MASRSRRARWRRALLHAAGMALVVLVAAAIAATVLALTRERASAPAPPPLPPAPALSRAVNLYAAPEEGARAIAELTSGTAVVLRGRSADARWLVVELPDRFDLVGWVPADAVAHAGDLRALTLFAGTARPTPEPAGAATPTLAAERPDLRVLAVGSRANRLLVVVGNAGHADMNDAIYVTVSGGARTRVDAGKALRPGDTLEAVLDQEYVQRRATVTVAVAGTTGVTEERSDNNTLTAVVEPDQPNDIELLDVALDAADGHVVVRVRSNSAIPLVGTVTLSLRSTQPARLLTTRLVPLDLAAGAVQRYDLADVTGVALDALQAYISTDAINDAVPANNSFPR